MSSVLQADGAVVAAVDTPLAAIAESLSQVGATSSVEEPQAETVETVLPCIQVRDSATHKNGQVYEVELFGSGCLECSHLVEDGDVEYKKCHFTMGNTACPAAFIKLTFIGERVKWDKKIDNVLGMTPDVNRRNKLLALIDAAKEIESDALQAHVLGRLGL